jgi:hypothetical protein
MASQEGSIQEGWSQISMVTTPKAPTPVSGSTDPSAAKLSLSKSLQAALVTTASTSADQFQKIWAEVCNELGNQMAPNVGLRV